MQPAKKIKRDKTPEQAYAALIRLCARSEKSSGDALRLMQRWGVKPSARQGVLQKLSPTDSSTTTATPKPSCATKSG
ncbi:MAG: hypothetical protein ACLURY_03665 [Alistipes putredinis]